jgi:phage shock protein PspC (stress-responsive transcriptional regulator)
MSERCTCELCVAGGFNVRAVEQPPRWVVRLIFLMLCCFGAAVGTVLGETILWVLR